MGEFSKTKAFTYKKKQGRTLVVFLASSGGGGGAGGTGCEGSYAGLCGGSMLDERLGAEESSQSLAFEVLHTRVESFGTA